MKRRALVAGASGYVGGRLIPRLLDDGWHVSAMARRAAAQSAASTGTNPARSTDPAQALAGARALVVGAAPLALASATVGIVSNSLRTPRASGFRPGVSLKTFGIRKRLRGHVVQLIVSRSCRRGRLVQPHQLPADGLSRVRLEISARDAKGLLAPDGTVLLLSTTLGRLPASVTTREGRATVQDYVASCSARIAALGSTPYTVQPAPTNRADEMPVDCMDPVTTPMVNTMPATADSSNARCCDR